MTCAHLDIEVSTSHCYIHYLKVESKSSNQKIKKFQKNFKNFQKIKFSKIQVMNTNT